MLIGLLNGQRIATFSDELSTEEKRILSQDGKILCPICKAPYTYCDGEIKTAYFRHKAKSKCNVLYEEKETQEHILGKQVLFNWIKCIPGVKDPMLEVWIPQTQQRADILFYFKNELYVIEYQCSPIATEYYERHRLYQSIGINDIWICGTEKYFSTIEKPRRVKSIGKESKIYFNPFTQIFSFDLNMISFKNYKCHWETEGTRLFDVPITEVSFNKTVIAGGKKIWQG